MAYPTCEISYLSQSSKIISISLLCLFVSSCISIFVSKSVRALVTSFLTVFVITMETVFNKHDDMKLIILSMNLMTQSANDGSSLALIITIIITSQHPTVIIALPPPFSMLLVNKGDNCRIGKVSES